MSSSSKSKKILDEKFLVFLASSWFFFVLEDYFKVFNAWVLLSGTGANSTWFARDECYLRVASTNEQTSSTLTLVLSLS